jgi:hypothetical protein
MTGTDYGKPEEQDLTDCILAMEDASGTSVVLGNFRLRGHHDGGKLGQFADAK